MSSPPASPVMDDSAPSNLSEEEIANLHSAPKEEGEISATLSNDQASAMRDIASQAIKLGQTDPSNAGLPSFMFRTESGLESTAHMFNNQELFVTIQEGDTPVERMLRVVKWMIGAVAAAAARGAKKPFNPILGEVFRKDWKHPKYGKTHVVAEQVSHHPPRSAVAVFNKKAKTFLEGMWEGKVKFRFTSILIQNLGRMRLTLAAHKEVYELTLPSIKISGILWGKFLIEWIGNVQVSCEQSGLSAVIDFKEKPWFRGKYHCVGGKVSNGKQTLYSLEGMWMDEVQLIPANKSEKPRILFDATEAAKTVSEGIVKPISEQDDFESQKVWHAAAEAIKAEKWKEANAAKDAVEVAQRARTKEMKSNNEEYTGKLFTHNPKAKHHGLNWEYTNMEKLVKKAEKK